jgi:hypothetical protein
MKRAKLEFYFLFLLTIGLQVNGQYFNKTYDYNNNLEMSRGITSDSYNIYFVSNFIASIPNTSGVLLTKLDYSGNVIWRKPFIWSNQIMYMGQGGSLHTAANGIVHCGTIEETGQPSRCFIVKWNLDGDTVFTRQFYQGAGSSATSLFIDEDGSMFLFGTAKSVSNNLNDLAIWKLDYHGNIIWAQVYPLGGPDFCVGGTVDSDGNIYISGGRNYSPNVYGQIVKTDPNGDYINRRFLFGTVGVSIRFYDNYLWLSSFVNLVNNQDSPRLYIAKLDTDMNTQWDRTYLSFFYSVVSNPPILVHDKMYVVGDVMDVYPRRTYLLMCDTMGQVQFLRTYIAFPGGITHYNHDVTKTSDGGFAIAGWAANPNQDAWVVKVDSMGCLVPNCALSEEELPATTAIQIWPNPTEAKLTVEIRSMDTEGVLIIKDLMGRSMMQKSVAQSEKVLFFNLEHLVPGIYILQFVSSNGQSDAIKVVKQ